MTILHMYSNIIISINGFDNMVTLYVYFEYIQKFVKYLFNILCPYYKFIQAILFYVLKLLQMTFIITWVLCNYTLRMMMKK